MRRVNLGELRSKKKEFGLGYILGVNRYLSEDFKQIVNICVWSIGEIYGLEREIWELYVLINV